MNTQVSYNITCHNILICQENIDSIRILLENGIDVNAKDDHFTALMIAAGIEYGITINLAAMRLLIEYGADVNVFGKHNLTALMAASGWANYANTYAISLLISNGANINAIDRFGNTALIYSTGINTKKKGMANLEAFKLLLKNGADINIVNKYGNTALTYIYNVRNAHSFQSVINNHYRKEAITYLESIKNIPDVVTTTVTKFLKISVNARRDWARHISSFLSIDAATKPN
uniref:Uncharacterized protein n=1 Tax=viral metagenome TaxID=1070528 RepID=A0A6C0I0B6_9ZZZZ